MKFFLKAAALTTAALTTLSAPALAQDITPDQAKTVADQFVKCSGLYAAGAEMMRNSGDAESISTAETGDAMSAQAEIAALVLYVMFEIPGSDGISARTDAEEANYKALLNSGASSVNTDLATCTDMVDLQQTLFEMAQKAFNEQ